MNGKQNELGAEFSAMLGTTEVTEEESTEEETTDAEEAESTEEDEALQEEAEKAEEETTEEEEESEGDEQEEKESDELEQLRAENELLKAKLKGGEKEKPTGEAEAEQEEELKLSELKPEDFLKSDDDYDKVLSNKDALNKVLNEVVQKTRQVTTEEVLRRVTMVAAHEAQRAIAFNDVVRRFFNSNKDLLPQRQLVGLVFEETLQKNPGKSYDELLEKLVAPEVRKRLKMEKPKQPKKKNPSFAPGTKGARPAPKKPSGLKAEIDAMLNVR